jgi:hypothetical protein
LFTCQKSIYRNVCVGKRIVRILNPIIRTTSWSSTNSLKQRLRNSKVKRIIGSPFWGIKFVTCNFFANKTADLHDFDVQIFHELVHSGIFQWKFWSFDSGLYWKT